MSNYFHHLLLLLSSLLLLYRVGKVLDNVRLHADDVTVGNDEVGGGKMLDDDAELVKFATLAPPSTPNRVVARGSTGPDSPPPSVMV